MDDQNPRGGNGADDVRFRQSIQRIEFHTGRARLGIPRCDLFER